MPGFPIAILLSVLVIPSVAAAQVAAKASGAPKANIIDNVPMVELFTSQGCSRCPPADRNLAELADRDDVLALALHVDYWDYLGWRDTFGQAEHTARQAEYRDKLGSRVLFTPQMIVEGAASVPGFRLDLIDAAIEKAERLRHPVSIDIRHDDGMLLADITGAQDGPSTIWVATYDQSATVAIERGENAGQTITYRNIVDKLMKVGPWHGAGSDSLPLPQPGPGEGIAVWLQDDHSGHILGASFIEE